MSNPCVSLTCICFSQFRSLKHVNSTPIARSIPRELLVWHTDIWIDDGTKYSAMEFSRSHKVSNIWIDTIGLVKNDQYTLSVLLNDTAMYGMSVDALYGTHSWTYSANHYIPIDLATRTVNYVKNLNVIPRTDDGSGGDILHLYSFCYCILLFVLSIIYIY